MRVALVQMFCGWGKVRDNLQRTAAHIRAAARAGAKLVVFPEASVHGLWKDHMVRLAAEPLDGPAVQRVCAMARRWAVAVGFGVAERTAGKPLNAYVVVDRGGQVVGVHRKNYVTRLEQNYYRCDRRRPVFELDGVRLAVGVCADCSHAELMHSFGRRGARVVLMPHAWDADPLLADGTSKGWKSIQEMVDHNARGLVTGYRNHRQMLARFVDRARPPCQENGYYGLFVNQVGQPHPLIPFVGPSFAMDARGQVVARSRGKRESVLYADIEL